MTKPSAPRVNSKGEVIREYGPVGRCIYCPALIYSDERKKLGDEHIIPFSLGNDDIIKEASCKKCEGRTSYIEGYAANALFKPLRIQFDIQSRSSKKDWPTELPIKYYDEKGQLAEGMAAIEHHKLPTAMMLYPYPGILTDAKKSAVPRRHVVHLHRETQVKLSTGHVPDKVRLKYSINERTFLRLLAKIAHCEAISELGIDGFVHFLPKIILADHPHAHYYVGGIPGQHPASASATHMRTLCLLRKGEDILVLVRIRLFTNIGNPGTPHYLVAVGRLLVDPANTGHPVFDSVDALARSLLRRAG